MAASSSPVHKDLLVQISNGDEDAFRELYDRYQQKVYYLAWKLLNSEREAKDVLQEIFLKLWINREKLAALDQFNSYLNTIVRNHIYDRFRAKAVQEVYLSGLNPEENNIVTTPIEQLALKQLEKILNDVVEALPPQQKKVFRLSRLMGIKHEQIAREMGISKETVKKHMMAALQTIRVKLAENGISLPVLLLLTILF